MSNSSLVDYACMSPNHSGERTKSIDRITPHCVVGKCSVETLGNISSNPSRKASSNYGIGVDGRVGLYVEECNRSWCSSSNANDQRSVTIECASDAEEPYTFNDTVYEKLIELCIDICKRNGKKKLLWIEDKTKALKYSPAEDEMLLTVHRWFAAKACPGEWMMQHMQDLADRVTDGLTEKQPEPVGADPVAIAWNYLLPWINNEFAVAGIIGNLIHESNVTSWNLQNSFNISLGMSDAEYTAAVDNGCYDNFIHDGAGYGIAQWTYWSRKEGLYNLAKQMGVSIGDFMMQLKYLTMEIENNKSLMSELSGCVSVRGATEVILKKYERPADMSIDVVTKRTKSAMSVYNANHKEADEKIYRVQAGAFSYQDNAQKFASLLRGKGFSTIIKKVTVNETVLYKVQVGAFKNKLNADAMLLMLKDAGVSGIIVEG